MPQEFQVLRCYSCGTFQVHQVKKVLKYNCKVCGDKQSIKKVYGRGTGADCRRHVQKCNMLRCELDMASEQQVDARTTSQQPEPPECTYAQANKERSTTSNKWHNFLDQPEDDDGENDLEDEQYTTNKQQYNQVKKDNSKAARQRWKSWKEQKYGSYNSKRHTDEKFQDLGNSTGQYANHQTNRKFGNKRNEMSTAVTEPSYQLYTSEAISEPNFNSNALKNSLNRHEIPQTSSLFVNIASDANKMVSNVNEKELSFSVTGTTNGRVGISKPFKADSSKSRKKEQNKIPKNSAQSSRWSAFLGSGGKDSESSDSEDYDDNSSVLFTDRNLSSSVSGPFREEQDLEQYQVTNRPLQSHDSQKNHELHASLQTQSNGQASLDSGDAKNVFDVGDDLDCLLDDW